MHYLYTSRRFETNKKDVQSPRCGTCRHRLIKVIDVVYLGNQLVAVLTQFAKQLNNTNRPALYCLILFGVFVLIYPVAYYDNSMASNGHTRSPLFRLWERLRKPAADSNSGQGRQLIQENNTFQFHHTARPNLLCVVSRNEWNQQRQRNSHRCCYQKEPCGFLCFSEERDVRLRSS